MEKLKIINYDEHGITRLSLSEIYNQLVTLIKDTYGGNVDINPDNADGIIQRAFAEFLADVSKLAERTYNTLNLDLAEGIHLDALCSLVNVRRRKASATTGHITVTLGTNVVLEEGENLMMLDSDNVSWYGPIVTETTTISDGDSLIIESGTYGGLIPKTPIIAVYKNSESEGTSTLLSGSFSITSWVLQSLGSLAESDSELRARRYALGVGIGSATLADSISHNLLSQIPMLSDVMIYNNNTDVNKTISVRHGTSTLSLTLIPHDVMILVKPKYGSVISEIPALQSNIAEIIRRRLTLGIRTWKVNGGTAPDGYYEKEFAVEGHNTWKELYSFIESQRVNPEVKIRIKQLPGFNHAGVKARITDVLITSCKSYRINQEVYGTDLVAGIASANEALGLPTFKPLEVVFKLGSIENEVLTVSNGYWYVDETTVVTLLDENGTVITG